MERKLVAAFVADIYRDMVRKTQYGAIMAAKRNNVKLLFYTIFSDNYSNLEYTELTNYDIGEFAIYHLPDLNKYSGLIAFDSYMPEIIIDPLNELKRNAPCPVVTLGDIHDFSYNVVNDQERSFMELIEHLIVEHECKDLVHVAGRLEMSFSRDRVQVFKKTLDKYHLPNEDNRIIQGNLWYDCGERVVNQILDRYVHNVDKILPDAIVCANDYMAIGVIEALDKKGFSVPEDVIVTGYDDVIQANYNDPSITTSSQPFEQVGKNGINILVDLWNKKQVPHVVAEPGIIMKRQSCGCEPKKIYKQDDLRESYNNTIVKLGQLSESITDMIIMMSNAETDDDVFDVIEANCCKGNGFNNAILCLMDNWEQQKIVKSHEDLKDADFRVVCGIYNKKSIKREKLPRGQYLPDRLMNDSESYYLVPIHHLQYFMGYFIVSPDLEELAQTNIKTWFINIGSMLENWRLKKELKRSLNELESLYMTDMLTGLFNRRGYAINFPKYYKDALEKNRDIAVFVIDMDNMKYINDTYGHDEGDYCLCTIGKAMRKASLGNEICIRSGGDEFVVLANNYNEEKKNKYIEKIRKIIDITCENDEKPFNISISIGCFIATPKTCDNISLTSLSEEYLREADTLMYIEKKEHKKNQKNKSLDQNTN